MIQLHHWHQHHQNFFIISIVNVVITTRVWQEPEHLPPAATPMLICNRDAHRNFIARPMDATHHTSFVPISSTCARGRLRTAEVTNAVRQRRHVQHQQRISAAGSIVFKRRSRGAKQLSLHCNSPTQPAGFVLKVAHAVASTTSKINSITTTDTQRPQTPPPTPAYWQSRKASAAPISRRPAAAA